jgi:hypothetical protein
MVFKKVHKISDDVYGIIKSFENYSIYHSKQWHLFLNKTFKWDVQFVLGICDEKVCFILPYIEKKRYNLKNYTIALPFSHKINIAYDKKNEIGLLDFENKIAEEFANIEVHQECKSDVFLKKSINNITTINLSGFGCYEEYFKILDYKVTRYSKLQNANIVEKDMISDETASDFYNLELITRKRLGSPIYPKDFFNNLFRIIDINDIFVKILYVDSKPIAGVILLKDNDCALYAYSAYSNERKSYKLHTSEYLICEGIKWAFKKGCTCFDFGTTPNHLTGLKLFKEKWGGKTSIINYSYLNVNIKIDRTSFSSRIVSVILSKLPTKLFEISSMLIIKYVV